MSWTPRRVDETLARFNAASDSLRSSYTRHTVRTGAEVREVSDVLDPGSSLQRLVQRTGAEAQRQLTHLSEHGLRWGIRHGDPTLDNLHVSDAGLYFYDFDLAGPGWQVGDLTGALSTEFADAFLTGYTAVRRRGSCIPRCRGSRTSTGSRCAAGGRSNAHRAPSGTSGRARFGRRGE